MDERRFRPRVGMDFFFNKYVRGYPHLCRAIDVSASGIQAVAINEPDNDLDAFPIELKVPGDTYIYWLWGRRVRASGRRQSIEFLHLSPTDSHRLVTWLGSFRRTG